MIFNLKELLSVVVLLCILGCSVACSSGKGGPSGVTSSGADVSSSASESGTTSVNGEPQGELQFTDTDMFTDRDSKVTYDTATAIAVKFNENSISAGNKSVVIKKNVATVTAEGTYILSGKLTDGQIVVEADETAKIQLVLSNADISCSSSAAVYIKSADKVFVTLADGSVNTLKTTGAFTPDGETNVDGVVFSKADITFNGNGKLNVETANGHGIVTKDDLKFTSGEYTVKASGHALNGKDSIRIKNGTFSLTSTKDGLHSVHDENAEKGYVYISGGKFNIVADGDGIHASNSVSVSGGEFCIKTGGGYTNAEKKSNDFGFGGHQNYQQNTATDSTSCKGIKADGSLTLDGCKMTVDSADDALHCGGTLNVKGGSFYITTGDDGLHSDSSVVINDGEVEIAISYEGIEGITIDINGGNIRVVSSDDGLNAAGGNDRSGFGGMMGRDQFMSNDNCYIKLSGGVLTVNASGDGVDSNGNLYVSGGECYVSGPTNSGNGALDYGGNAVVSGGVFVASGTMGMAQNFGSSSSQCAMLVNTGSANGTLKVKDSSGKVILTADLEKTYQCVVISSPSLKVGETYTVSTVSGDVTVTLSSTIYGSSGGMGGGFGGPGGGGDFGGPGGKPNRW